MRKNLDRKKIIESIALIILVLSIANYQRINGSDAMKISEEHVAYSNEPAEYDGNQIITGNSACIYHIGNVKTEVRYSAFYAQDVFRYIIPFTAFNVSEEESEVDIDQTIRVKSSGNVWDAIARSPQDLENDLNGETKWTLKGGDRTKGFAIVDVCIDELHPISALEDFQVYSVSHLDGVIYKYQVE